MLVGNSQWSLRFALFGGSKTSKHDPLDWFEVKMEESDVIPTDPSRKITYKVFNLPRSSRLIRDLTVVEQAAIAFKQAGVLANKEFPIPLGS